MNESYRHLVRQAISEKWHIGLFKGGVVLVSAAMLSIAQVGPFLYEKDIEARKSQLAIEYISRQAIDKTDCNTLRPPSVTDCKIAKYQIRLLDSGTHLLLRFFKFSFYVGLLMLLASFLSFFIRLAYSNHPKNDE